MPIKVRIDLKLGIKIISKAPSTRTSGPKNSSKPSFFSINLKGIVGRKSQNHFLAGKNSLIIPEPITRLKINSIIPFGKASGASTPSMRGTLRTNSNNKIPISSPSWLKLPKAVSSTMTPPSHREEPSVKVNIVLL